MASGGQKISFGDAHSSRSRYPDTAMSTMRIPICGQGTYSSTVRTIVYTYIVYIY
jgi:hypothetical protein